MPDHPSVPEQRTVDVNVENLDTRGRTLHGYAAVYGVESGDLGGFRERIAPGAFAQVLDSDVRCLLNHDPNEVLGRTRSGTLRLADEQRGLRFECDLPDSPLGHNVREAVRRGDLDGASFRFKVADDEWDGEVRTIRQVAELHDVTVATYGAYPAASVELRTRPDHPPASAVTSVTASHEPQEGPTMNIEDRHEGGGGLQVEDRAARPEHPDVETRVLDAMRAVPKGESRSLTLATAEPVEPVELATFVWDRLRDAAVVLASGVRVIPTDRRSIKFPVITGDIAPDFYDELDEITPTDPTLAELEIEPRAIKALVRGSSEAFEDSSPDLLGLLQAHFQAVLALKLDRELLVGNAAKGFKGLANMVGTQTLAVAGALTNWDPILKAVGMLAEAHVPGPYAAVAHPRVATALGLLKTETGSNESLPRPEAAPPVYVSSQVGVTGGQTPTTTVLVYAPAQIVVARRRDVTVEVDRSQEFTSDAVLVRGKLRAAPGTAHPEAIVKLTGIAAPPIT